MFISNIVAPLCFGVSAPFNTDLLEVKSDINLLFTTKKVIFTTAPEITESICNRAIDKATRNQLSRIEYLGNVSGGNIIRYLNLETDELRKYTIKSIKADDPVWFGCDVGKYWTSKLSVLDTNMLNYINVFDTDISLNKKNRLLYQTSDITHAMLIRGYDNQTNQKY